MGKKLARMIALERRDIVLLTVAAVLVAGMFLFSDARSAFSSSEVSFVEHSESGLQIVPASCPSSPHYSGQCSGTIPCIPLWSGGCSCPSAYTLQGSTCVLCGAGGCGSYSQGSYDMSNPNQGAYYAQSSYYSQGAYCSATFFCSGDNKYYRNAQCGESLVEACAWGCSGGGCLPPPPPEGNITANPTVVRSGNTSVISWSAQYVESCTVTEDNEEIDDSWAGANGSQTSGVLTQQTVYTLRCTGVDGSQFTDSAKVNIIPVWEEL